MQHQQEFPISGAVMEDTLFSANSSTVIQHNYKNSKAVRRFLGQALSD